MESGPSKEKLTFILGDDNKATDQAEITAARGHSDSVALVSGQRVSTPIHPALDNELNGHKSINQESDSIYRAPTIQLPDGGSLHR